MAGFFQFMASMNGRITRVVAGLALVLLGMLSVQGTTGTIIAVVGLVPLAAGLFDFCVFSALFGGKFWGKDIRK
jgi:hypothetical protein